jgi:hypothetical protein
MRAHDRRGGTALKKPYLRVHARLDVFDTQHQMSDRLDPHVVPHRLTETGCIRQAPYVLQETGA